jgi:hypothetical protein
MTRIMLIVVMVAAVLAGIAQSTQEASAHTGYWRNTGNGLNLRSGPGGAYAVIGSVPAQAVVKAFGHRGNWLKLRVLSSGQVGWAWLWNFHQSSYVPPAPQPSLQLCWDSSFGVTYCAPYWIAQTIYDAAVRWGAPYWALMGIASCESGFNPNAYNPYSGVSGLFQFQPSTMAWIYPGGSVWSVYDSANAAAKMLAMGLSSHFDCAWRIGYY